MSASDGDWRKLRPIVKEMHLDSIFQDEKDRQFLLGRLGEFSRAYGNRLKTVPKGSLPPPPSVADLVEEYGRNPHRVQTLLQAVAFICSPEMLAMLWIVLLGASVERLRYAYGRRKNSMLEIEVLLPDRETSLTFKSNEHWDTAILRLAALSKSDDRPMIETFYPLYIPARR